MTEPFLQAGFEGVVPGIGDSGDQTRRRKFAGGWRVGERAAGIQAALVGVVWRGDSGHVDSRIAFDEAREFGPLGTDVSDLQKQVRSERTLDVKVPILRVGKRKLGVQREIRQRGGELAVHRRIPIKRIGKVGGTDLLGLQVGRRADQ